MLFKKKDKRSNRVAAIVKYYDEMQLPLPPELVEVAKKEGWVVPDAKQAPPAPEPVKVEERKGWVPPPDMPSRPVVAELETGTPGPGACEGPGKGGLGFALLHAVPAGRAQSETAPGEPLRGLSVRVL